MTLSVPQRRPPLPSATLRDTGPLTDTPLPPQLVVEKCAFFIFFLALRINLNLNLSFFSL